MFRHEWDLDPDFVTVNHGSYGATPRTVLAAQRVWQDRMERQPTRFMATVLPPALRSAADQLGTFLNADGADIVFLDNATTGCNAVLRSMMLRPGEEIVLLSHAYGAVRNAVRHVAKLADARITEAAITFPDPTADGLANSVRDAITPRTRLAVIDHITSGSALVLPVERIVAVCHAAGVPVLIDGAHAPGQIDLDLTAIGADWYVGNCHNLGGAAFRRRNRELAEQATRLLAHRLNSQPGATGDLVAAMGTVRLPVADPSAAHALLIRERLLAAGTDAPVHALEGALWLRLSAFAYNRMQDYERLADIAASVLRETDPPC